MTDNVRKLGVVKAPTADESIRKDVIAELERALEEAKRGEITELFMILKHPGDDEWSNRATPTQHMTAWIGKLEVTKLEWAADYKKDLTS